MNVRSMTLHVLLAAVLAQSAFGGATHRTHKHPSRARHSPRSVKTTDPSPDPATLRLDDEEQRYEAAKEAAKADPVIQRLKAQSDAAAGEAARDAAIAYYRALFQKIREADRSLTERADLTEAALMRRLKE